MDRQTLNCHTLSSSLYSSAIYPRGKIIPLFLRTRCIANPTISDSTISVTGTPTHRSTIVLVLITVADTAGPPVLAPVVRFPARKFTVLILGVEVAVIETGAAVDPTDGKGEEAEEEREVSEECETIVVLTGKESWPATQAVRILRLWKGGWLICMSGWVKERAEEKPDRGGREEEGGGG